MKNLKKKNVFNNCQLETHEHQKSIQTQMQNQQLALDFMLCNLNSLLYQAKTNKISGNTCYLLQALYQSFLIYKQKIVDLFQKINKVCVQNKEKDKNHEQKLKEDFFSKLQSLQILAYQKDYQALIKRISQYKKMQSSQVQEDEISSFFQQSSISKIQHKQQYLESEYQQLKCNQFQQFTQKKRNKITQVNERLCCQPNQEDSFNMVFDNIKIKEAYSVQLQPFFPKSVQNVIQQIKNQKTKLQRKQQIWLSYLKKSQSDEESLKHIEDKQVLKAIETFRTQIKSSNRQSGVQELIQTRFHQNQIQLKKNWNSPINNFIQTEVNQLKKQEKKKNKSLSLPKHKQLIKRGSTSKSSKRPSKNKDDKQNLKQYNLKSLKTMKAKMFASQKLQSKIQKKLCLNKEEKQNHNLQTNKKVPINKRKNQKSSQKKTIKKTLISFCS